MHFGFSYTGLIFLVLLMVPNILWTKHKPLNYEKYAANENRTLRLLERTGEAAVSCTALTFSDFNPKGFSVWEIWFLAACALMFLYEIYWVRYFRSSHALQDFYSSLLGVPVAGATLPVLAFLCLGVYGRNWILIAAVVMLGIGHIGIHLGHMRECMRKDD